MLQHSEPWSENVEREYHEKFTAAKEKWLDAGHGSCVLRKSDCRGVMESTLTHFDGMRCEQLSWVVMPNHVHLLFVLNPTWTLEQLVHSWKRQSAREINKILGRTGALWQKDYFDRLIRDSDHLGNCVQYIRRNPLKAKLRPREYTLWESGTTREIQ